MSKSRKWGTVAVRVLVALPFLISGLNKLLHLFPLPPPPPGAGALLGAFAASGYLLPLIGATEVAGAALLIAGRWLPLALVVLAPVTVNIVAFHAFLAPAGLAVPVLLAVGQAWLAWQHRAAFAPLFAAPARAADEGIQLRNAIPS